MKKQTKVRIQRRAIAQKSGEPLIKLKKATTRDNTEENRQTSGEKKLKTNPKCRKRAEKCSKERANGKKRRETHKRRSNAHKKHGLVKEPEENSGIVDSEKNISIRRKRVGVGAQTQKNVPIRRKHVE